jgi:hypothetical protein
VVKRGPKNIKIEFSGESITHFGGLALLQRFLHKINLRILLNRYLRFYQQNNRYSIAEEILALLYPIVLGLGRIETFHLLKHNGVFQYLPPLRGSPLTGELRGAGKTFLACALGQATCRNGFSVRYFQISKLLQKLLLAHADGSWPKLLDTLTKTQLLIIDDWLRNPLTDAQTMDLLEMLEDRSNRASTLLVTQIPVSDWYERLANGTLSYALMDRIIHNAYRLELSGESMQKRRSPLTQSGHKEI